jgi:hypothetical protein
MEGMHVTGAPVTCQRDDAKSWPDGEQLVHERARVV